MLHVLTGEQMRSVVGLGATRENCDVGLHVDEVVQCRLLVSVAGTDSYCDEVHTVKGIHTRVDVAVGAVV